MHHRGGQRRLLKETAAGRQPWTITGSDDDSVSWLESRECNLTAGNVETARLRLTRLIFFLLHAQIYINGIEKVKKNECMRQKLSFSY